MTSAVDPTKKQTTSHYTANDDEVTYFAQTNFRGDDRRFGIKLDDRRRHMYMIGKTGMGKSTLLENMIIQDIQNGKGLAVVDPHGDLVEKVINYIPSHRVNDVVYFNPADVDHPIAFNILEQVSAEYKNLVSNGLVGVFKKIWADSWGPRLEYILINAILALLEHPGSTLLGVTRMLVDPQYRKKVLKSVKDPVVKAFWVTEYNNYSEKFRNEAISPIQNKVGQFLSSSLIRNIVGQTKSTINMRDIMDSGKILLMNLSKGRIGEENAALLGAMMITKIQLAAMSRVDILEKERRDFFLYVDEFQNFSTEAFAGILSEARKYRLDLIMAHQYIEQLSDEVRAAVFGNVGTLIAFRVGAMDAEELEKEFQPTFMQEHLVTLPSYHIYLRLMIDGVASEPFSATTLPPVSGENDNASRVITVSRERYARNRVVVEEKIARWAGVLSDAESGKFTDEEDTENGELQVSSHQGKKSQGTITVSGTPSVVSATSVTRRPTPALVRIRPQEIPRPPMPTGTGSAMSSTLQRDEFTHLRQKGISFIPELAVRVEHVTPQSATTPKLVVAPQLASASGSEVVSQSATMPESTIMLQPKVAMSKSMGSQEFLPERVAAKLQVQSRDSSPQQQSIVGQSGSGESSSKKRRRRRRKKKKDGVVSMQSGQQFRQQPEQQPSVQVPSQQQSQQRKPQQSQQHSASASLSFRPQDSVQQQQRQPKPFQQKQRRNQQQSVLRPVPQQQRQQPPLQPSQTQRRQRPVAKPPTPLHTLQPGQSIKL